MSDLREALEGAFRGEASGSTDTGSTETDIQPGPSTDQGAEQSTSEQLSTRIRDEHGRFAGKGEQPADKSTATTSTPPDGADAGKSASPTDPAKAQQDGGQPKTGSPVAPPQGWSDTAKVQWNRLPRGVQEELAKQQQASGDFEQVLAPHRSRYAPAGISDQVAIQNLLAADEALSRDPEGTILTLAKSYGVDLSKLAGTGAAPGSQDESEYVDPQLKALHDKIATFEQIFQTQSDASAQQNRERISRQVTEFRDSHPHYDIVAPEMAKLIKAGICDDLQSAYDRAAWANSAVRAELVREQQESEAKKRADEAAARTRAARMASGSVTGSPGGRGAPHGDPSANSLRDVISGAIETSRV
jgi:hypothetical protein